MKEIKYHTEEEYINRNLSAIARNTDTSIKKVIQIYETSLDLLNNDKRKALVNTHNCFKREYYYQKKAKFLKEKFG